ncbi:hypothetical protein [Sorangium sp. So ce131]|uniref:hypothetical protein n=1 Tax=Sorangium sp. So ce131 TaxID=3133282 RepID=UPI003F63888D
MGLRQSLENLERVSEVATLAGINGKIDEDRMHFGMGFQLDQGRSQTVYVRDSSREGSNKVVTILSPCLVVKKGLFSGLSKDRALDLLRLNESVLFARYGIWEKKSELMIVASIDHLLDTLDPEEFKASAFHVAVAADAYERKYGKDEF